MKHLVLTAAAGATLLAATILPTTGAGAAPAQASARHSARTCAAAPAGYAACDARVVVDANGKPLATATPSGYGPADIQAAYKLAGLSTGSTVAIVDAYNDPTAAADLAVYRSQYGLPACTTATGCLRITNQSGGSSLPRTNAGWATEISLDLDMVSAACPSCKILLVEANSASFADLGAGVNYAATQGVAAISNSYGGSDSAQSSAYKHPGIAVTASTGDSGYGVQSPASFDTVVAVGGTSLKRDSSSRGFTETAWSGAGSGCGTINATTIQNTTTTGCAKKANADISAVADPNTGVAVYDSTSYQGRKGWQVYGGTSASSPIIASVFALSGDHSNYPAASLWAAAAGTFNDPVSGSNGTCTVTKWCTAVAGWDGPTGLGTPKGTAGF